MKIKQLIPVILLFILVSFSVPNLSTLAVTTSPSIILGKNIIGEGEDFATLELGLPWDMSGSPYPGISTGILKINYDTFSIEDSTWIMETADEHGANIWLHWTGIENTQAVLKTGARYPVDTNKYKLLSFYLCSNESENANLYWFYTQAPHTTMGVSKYITIEPTCKLYTMNLDEMPTFEGSWSGNPLGLRLDPVNTPANFSLSWVRLTSIDLTNILPIYWSGANPTSTKYFYLNSNGCSTNGSIPIGYASGPSQGAFYWGQSLQPNPTLSSPYPLPESLEPGEYFVYALENNYGSPICSNTKLTIHKAPILNFQKPSYYSGPDYATEVVGDPWGMGNSEDVIDSRGFSSINFNQGILDLRTNSSGNHIKLNVTDPIDTSKYKYVTSRFFVEGIRDIQIGWVQKYVWWYQGPSHDAVTTRPAIIEEGWHTYSYDLSQANIEIPPGGDWTGSPTGFRFDPVEISEPTNIHVDYIKLTGDEIISSGDIFDIYYEPNSEPGYQVTFFYDTDNNAQNGRSLIANNSVNAQVSLSTNSIFLPLVIKNQGDTSPPGEPPEINLFTGERYRWDTTGVPAGTYYISADIDDGVMTTTWYSELPIIITD